MAVLPRPHVPRAAAQRPSRAPGVWLRSPTWDLTFLILSAALVPIPLLLYHGLGVSQTAVNLIVAGLIGGPHLYSTFTYTFMEPNYRRRHRRFLAASLALPVIVTTMAFVNLQVLLTIFFMWASIHVLHQITYINDCYAAKGPVAAAGCARSVVDYGVVFLCLYPMATPQILDGSLPARRRPSSTCREWADHGIVADAADRRRRGAVRGLLRAVDRQDDPRLAARARCSSRASCSSA